MKKAKTRAPSPARLSSGVKIAAALSTSPTSKYQVETEKNLGIVLANSPSTNITLIVDDADDLFGKRSPTKPQ